MSYWMVMMVWQFSRWSTNDKKVDDDVAVDDAMVGVWCRGGVVVWWCGGPELVR